MSKFAVRALAEALGPELEPDGVAVTLISPGFITSEIRQVDNRGVHHPFAKEPLPAWLVMPAEIAAKKIVAAAYRRRREAIITVHGKAFVCATAVRALGISARRTPRRPWALGAGGRQSEKKIGRAPVRWRSI